MIKLQSTRATLVVVVAILVGVTNTLSIKHNAGPAPLAFSAIRMGYAVIFFLPLVVIPKWNAPGTQSARALFHNRWLYIGAAGWAGTVMLGFTGTSHTSAINAGVIGAMSPVFTIAVGAIWFRKQIGKSTSRQIGLAIVASIAASLAVAVSKSGSGANHVGDAFVVASVIVGPFWLLAAAVLVKRVSATLIIACATIVCFVMILPFALVSGQFGDVDRGIWIGAAWCAVGGTTQNFLQTWAMKHVSPSVIAVATLIAPLGLASSGWYFFNERFAIAQAAAGLVAVGAVALLARDRAVAAAPKVDVLEAEAVTA